MKLIEITRSPTVTVRFAGFVSTTTELQQCGWDLSAQQDKGDGRVRLALRHKSANLYGLTNTIDLSRWWMSQPTMTAEFVIVTMASTVRCSYVAMAQSYAQWSAINAFPQASVESVKELDIEQLVPFVTVNRDAEQIIVRPDSVPQVLDMLLRCQAPLQAEIRERQRKTSLRENIAAQVIVAAS